MPPTAYGALWGRWWHAVPGSSTSAAMASSIWCGWAPCLHVSSTRSSSWPWRPTSDSTWDATRSSTRTNRASTAVLTGNRFRFVDTSIVNIYIAVVGMCATSLTFSAFVVSACVGRTKWTGCPSIPVKWTSPCSAYQAPRTPTIMYEGCALCNCYLSL